MERRTTRDIADNKHFSEEESDIILKYEEQPPTLLPENVAAPAATNTQKSTVNNFEEGLDAKIKFEELPPILSPENGKNIGMASSQHALTKEKHNPVKIWEGDVEWQENVEVLNGCRITILANSSRDKTGLEADTWPLKLTLQLVPQRTLQNVRGTHLRKAPSGMCLARASHTHNALRRALILGRVGFVFPQPTLTNRGKRVLIFQYSFKRKAITVRLQCYSDAIIHRIEKAIHIQLHRDARRTSMRKKETSVETRRRISTEIWKGSLQWTDTNSVLKGCESHNNAKCRVLAKLTDGKPEVKADSWPQRLVVQLVPKRLLRNIGEAYLKDSKSVLFDPTTAVTLEGLTKVMGTSLAGYIRFTSVPTLGDCDIKVLILLYSPGKKIHIGFIPNDQTEFIRRFENETQQENRRPESMRLELPGTMPSLTAAPTKKISTSVTALQVEDHKSANVMAIEAVKSQDGTEKRGKSLSNDMRIARKPEKENMVPGGILESQIDKGKGMKRHLCYPMQRARELNLLLIESLSQGIAIMEENLEVARQQERKYGIQESEYAAISQAKRRCDQIGSVSRF